MSSSLGNASELISERYAHRPFEPDFDCVSTQEVIWHFRELLKVDDMAPNLTEAHICPPYVVQHMFDLAHSFGQPAIVKIHAVNLLENLLKRGASIAQVTLPMIIAIAAKLNLSYNYVSLSEIQDYLRSRSLGEFSARQLVIHEEQILLTLDFKVESETILQLVETLFTLVHRSSPLDRISVHVETAGYLSCLYVLYRRFMPRHLKFSRRFAACALTLAARMILDNSRPPYGSYDARFVRSLSQMTLIEEPRLVSDAGNLLTIIIRNDRKFFLNIPSAEKSRSFKFP